MSRIKQVYFCLRNIIACVSQGNSELDFGVIKYLLLSRTENMEWRKAEIPKLKNGLQSNVPSIFSQEKYFSTSWDRLLNNKEVKGSVFPSVEVCSPLKWPCLAA